MQDIEKRKNAYGYDEVVIKTEEGNFIISYMPNLDLYWLLDKKIDNNKKFKITKENSYLYNAFEGLYNAIENDTPFSNYENEEELENEEEFENKEDSNFKYKKVAPYNSSKALQLLKGNTIEWHSDDFPYDTASILTIKKIKDEFDVTFTKSHEEYLLDTSSIRFRNSGSLYDPFNISFMNMYHKLINYDYQVTFDEILYQQEKNKKKTRKK